MFIDENDDDDGFSSLARQRSTKSIKICTRPQRRIQSNTHIWGSIWDKTKNMTKIHLVMPFRFQGFADLRQSIWQSAHASHPIPFPPKNETAICHGSPPRCYPMPLHDPRLALGQCHWQRGSIWCWQHPGSKDHWNLHPLLYLHHGSTSASITAGWLLLWPTSLHSPYTRIASASWVKLALQNEQMWTTWKGIWVSVGPHLNTVTVDSEGE